jgi:hypothetical protein
MSRQRDDRKRNSRMAFTLAKNPAYVCRNCCTQGRHYLPPSLGEPGRFICSVGSFICSQESA